MDKLMTILGKNGEKGEIVENIVFMFSNLLEDHPHVVYSFIEKK